MKKLLLSLGLSVIVGGGSFVFAQRAIKKSFNAVKDEILSPPPHRTCGTPVLDDPRFEEWMAQGIAELEANGTFNQRNIYNIPVIVHIIHDGGPIGSTYNISAARVQSQIDVLNKDYSGTNTDIVNVPAVFQGVKAGDVGIRFCLATKDPQGNTLAEPGIHRVAASSIPGITWKISGQNQSDINSKIKPATIWDVSKYLNIWVVPIAGDVLGYATYPAGSGLTGLGSTFGTTTTDGVVIGTRYFGTGTGTIAPYNKGRTTTHEVGHWLGLRHISGDAPCGNDFVNDTPPQKGGANGATGGLNYGCPTHPFQVGQCTGNTDGEMFMNYMDYVDDACMYMFTAGQKQRMITCMVNGTYRKTLNASASVNCGNVGPVAPTADFSASPTTVLAGGTVTFTDLSSGAPTSWSWSATPSAGVTFSNANAQNPTATFANVGQYTITLIVSNSQGSDTATKSAYINVISQSSAPCDTLKNISNSDTLVVYGPYLGMDNGTPIYGYISGNNSYGDLAKAEFFDATAINGRVVNGAVILFYRNANKNLGTKAGANGNSNGKVTVQMLNKASNGKPGTTVYASKDVTLQSIVQTTPVNYVTYVGNPTLGYQNPIIYPVKVDFTTPVTINGDFFISVKLPTTTGDTAVIFQNTIDNINGYNTAYEDWGNNTWYAFNENGSWEINSSLAILPTTCPAPTGFNSKSLGSSGNVQIHPNPNNGIFRILTTLGDNETKIIVTDIVGRIVESKTEKSGNNYIQFDLSRQADGIYFVTVLSGNEKYIERISINR